MPNQDLFDLVGLLFFRTQDDQNKAIDVLYSNPVRGIESLTALLKVKAIPSISSEQLEAAKLSASTCLNYMLKVGVKEVDGVAQLGTFWDILFDWRIDMVHKLNLEDTFQYLYRFWYAKHDKIFQQGMAKVTRFLNNYSSNYCQLKSSVKLSTQNCEFFLWMDGYSPISNVLQTLLLIGRCCMASLACEKVYNEGFTVVISTITDLFRAIKKWNSEARVEMAKLETINWIIDCLQEADLDERNRKALIEQVYKRGRMADIIMETYKKGGKQHQGLEKGICWLCLGGNLQQRSKIMRQKEVMIKIHLRFVMNAKKIFEKAHTFLQREEEFEPSIIASLYCYASSKGSDSTADSFVSSLLELYTTHFKHYPQAFDNIYQITFKQIVLPLMEFEPIKQKQFQQDPLFLLNLLDNLRFGQTLDIPLVKAAALLRYIVVKYQIFYQKIIQNILKVFERQELEEQFWETKRPSLDGCLLILIILSENLKEDYSNILRLLQNFNKGIEIILSNYSLCLVAYLLKKITRDNKSADEHFQGFAKEGLQRTPHIRHFMMELYIEDQQKQFCWSFLQIAFKVLFLQRQQCTNIAYYQEIVEGSIKYHSELLGNQDILQLLTYSIDSCQLEISKSSCKVNKNMMLFTLRLVGCALGACQPEVMLQLNAQLTNLLMILQKQEYIQFQDEILELTHAFFCVQEKITSEHLLLAQNCIRAYKTSGNHELCLVIFSRIIKIASELSIPILLIFRQLSSIVREMTLIDEKQEKKLYKELLVIEYCIQSKGQSIDFAKVASLISQLLFLFEKPASPIIRCRTLNIMLAARLYLKMDSINWPFIFKAVESFRIPYDQQFLVVMKIEMLVNDHSCNKKVEEYAHLLRFLDKILRVTNRKAKTIEPICDCSIFLPFPRDQEIMEHKAKKVILSILRKKRFTLRLIEERLNNEEINFLRGIQLLAGEESAKEEAKAIAFLCS